MIRVRGSAYLDPREGSGGGGERGDKSSRNEASEQTINPR